MTFSVIVCAFNEEQLLPGCLHSLLQQSFPPHEIIVINNASTDRTAAVASIPGIRVVDEPRKGLVVARETGRRVSTGDVLVYVDADCRAPRDWLERIAQEFAGPNPPVAVTGPYRFYDWDIFGRLLIRMYDYSLAPLTHVLAQYVFRPRRRALRRKLRRQARCAGGDRRLRYLHRVPRRRHEPRAPHFESRPRALEAARARSSRRRAATKRWGAEKCSALYVRNFCAEIFPASAIRHHARRRSRLTSHAWIRALPVVRFPCTHDVERRAAVAARGRRSVRPDGEVRRPRDHRSHPCEERSARAARPHGDARPAAVLDHAGHVRRLHGRHREGERARQAGVRACSSFPAPR